ncbi:MAG: cytochrome c maturation protein CcmE [Chitinophagales bacterium]|nr:cytochrome c maturation protein CcmE [Chitinophagales bacterium]
MRKFHIVLLLCVAIAISVLISFMGTLTTYDTVQTARDKPGKFIHLVARLDHTKPVEYDAVNNPNYLSFTAIDSLGDAVMVVYRNAKPDNLEISDRLVLKGAIKEDYFDCREILMKCPSKYKDDIKAVEENLPNAGINKQEADNSPAIKKI